MKAKTFYLIDDDPIFHYMVKKSIATSNEKIELKIFNNGLEALDSLRSISLTDEFPDVIFLDLYMPILDGWEFLDQFSSLVKAGSKQTNIYMISGSQDIKTLHKAMDQKILSGYFSKPISQAELTMIIQENPKDYWDTVRQMESFGRLQSLRNEKLGVFQKVPHYRE